MYSPIVENTKIYLKEKTLSEPTGHDYFHSLRVWNMAKKLQKHEGGNLYVIEFASLLHDIADSKFHNGDYAAGPKAARRWLESQKADPEIISHVCEIIETMSFKGAKVKTEKKTLEGKIVQDADRLDALGAIGIARVFAYGGFTKRIIHDPEQKPVMHESAEKYQKHNNTTINHFYEKLLLLKDRMNTETAKKMAQKRHDYMEQFLDTFYREWNCEV